MRRIIQSLVSIAAMTVSTAALAATTYIATNGIGANPNQAAANAYAKAAPQCQNQGGQPGSLTGTYQYNGAQWQFIGELECQIP